MFFTFQQTSGFKLCVLSNQSSSSSYPKHRATELTTSGVCWTNPISSFPTSCALTRKQTEPTTISAPPPSPTRTGPDPGRMAPPSAPATNHKAWIRQWRRKRQGEPWCLPTAPPETLPLEIRHHSVRHYLRSRTRKKGARPESQTGGATEGSRPWRKKRAGRTWHMLQKATSQALTARFFLSPLCPSLFPQTDGTSCGRALTRTTGLDQVPLPCEQTTLACVILISLWSLLKMCVISECCGFAVLLVVSSANPWQYDHLPMYIQYPLSTLTKRLLHITRSTFSSLKVFLKY